ncbi:MAG: KH domain-containing protein [Bacilli bacterium]|jgi:uncharacterized protein|nr:KH domain-containing protein [Bacilli bacterium]MDD3422298.1 KH domain-containing protein [Bacilli bacterium]MDD4065739.1 KH domain-containing protein [Bacilli bacterium]
MEIEKLVHDIIDPLVENKEATGVRIMPTDDENEVLILVLGESNDVARLIGRGGSVADAIRKVVSVTGKLNDKHIRIKFESFDEEKKEKTL